MFLSVVTFRYTSLFLQYNSYMYIIIQQQTYGSSPIKTDQCRSAAWIKLLLSEEDLLLFHSVSHVGVKFLHSYELFSCFDALFNISTPR